MDANVWDGTKWGTAIEVSLGDVQDIDPAKGMAWEAVWQKDTGDLFFIWDDSKTRKAQVLYGPLGIDEGDPDNKITPRFLFEFFMTDFIRVLVIDGMKAFCEDNDCIVPTFVDVMKLLVVVLSMSVRRVRWTKHYWSRTTHELLGACPFIKRVMPRDHFWELFPIVFNWDIKKAEVDLNKKFKEPYAPSSHCTIDELMVPFKGRAQHWKVYIPNKRIKMGIKIFSVNDAQIGSYYLYDFVTYLKEETRAGMTTPDDLLRNADHLLPKGVSICGDRWFGGWDIARELDGNNRPFIFSCRKDRPTWLWDALSNPRFRDGETRVIQHVETGITAWAFQDRRGLPLWLTNGMPSYGINESEKGYVGADRRADADISFNEQMAWRRPIVRDLFQYAMQGADRFQQMLLAYRYDRRQSKWTTAVRVYQLGMVTTNAFILYNLVRADRKQKPVSHLKFMTTLIFELCRRYVRNCPVPKHSQL